MPAPLTFHPTRARRQFASSGRAALGKPPSKQRRPGPAAGGYPGARAAGAARRGEARLLGGVGGKGVKEARRRRYGGRGGPLGMDDDGYDDDDDDDDEDEVGDGGEAARGPELDFIGSDDSVEGGEDVGIVMRKSWRRPRVTEGREREILD